MKLFDKLCARTWLNENDIVIERYENQSQVFDAVTAIEIENGKISFNAETFEDFAFACIVKLKIPYSKFPVELKLDAEFLRKVCYAVPTLLEEIVNENPYLGTKLVTNVKKAFKSQQISRKAMHILKKVLLNETELQ